MLAQSRCIDTTTTYGGGLACLLCRASCAPERPKTIPNPSCFAMKPPSGRVVPCATTLSRRSFVDLGWSCQGGRGRPLFSGNPWPGGRRSDERTRKADPGPGCARPLQSVASTPRDPRGILASGYLPIALRQGSFGFVNRTFLQGDHWASAAFADCCSARVGILA